MKRFLLALIFSVLFISTVSSAETQHTRTLGAMTPVMTDSKPTFEPLYEKTWFVELVSLIAGIAVCGIAVKRVGTFFFECVAPLHLVKKKENSVMFVHPHHQVLEFDEAPDESLAA